MERNNDKTRYDLQAESEELYDILRGLDAVRGMVKESWSDDASKIFLSRLESVIAEAEDVKRTIDKTVKIEG